MDSVKRNVGTDDRVIRAVAGVVLLVLAFTGFLSPGWTAVSAALAVFLLVSAAAGYSILYQVMGWSTRRAEVEAE